jgi:DNA-binding NarL/FixJ family response regulator
MPASVLIVDDHPSFRTAARMLLEADGWTVVGEAPDGTSGLGGGGALLTDAGLL